MDNEFNMKELINDFNELTVENIREFESIDNDESEEFQQAVLQEIDDELNLTEGDPAEDDQDEQEEQMDQEALKSSLQDGMRFINQCPSCTLTCTMLVLLKLQIIGMKSWSMLMRASKDFFEEFIKRNEVGGLPQLISLRCMTVPIS